MTNTVAELELSPAAYQEISMKLKAAGYPVYFFSDGMIDMSGIGVTQAPHVPAELAWTPSTAIAQVEKNDFENEAGHLVNNAAWRWIKLRLMQDRVFDLLEGVADQMTNEEQADELRACFSRMTDGIDLGRAVRVILTHFDPVADVEAFHKKFGIHYTGKPRVLPFDIAQFRLKFMREEVGEYEQHADQAHFELDNPQRNFFDPIDEANLVHHMAAMLDGLADLVYVALGTAHLQGFDFREAWQRVHEANMAKVIVTNETDANNRMKLKISKPEGWEPPNHCDLVEDHAHRKAR